MNDLKVGDKVIVVKCPREGRELGWEGIVTSMSADGVSVRLTLAGVCQGRTYAYYHWQLIPESVYNSKLYKVLK